MPEDGPQFYNVILPLPAALDEARVLATAPDLTETALAFSAMREGNNHKAGWVLTWLFDASPDENLIRAALGAANGWRIEAAPRVSWLEHSYRQFQPFAVGPFFIYGSHCEDAPPPNMLPLQIDAATAFGSGEHGTTAGCLLALARLKEQGFAPHLFPGGILDMGCGSGILAIAAARLWAGTVIAVDIDGEAVVVTGRHAEMNNVADRIAASAGDGFASPEARGPFALVIANILAGPLVAMAPDLVRATAPGGAFILSGMLAEQAEEVAAAYRALGCTLAESFPRGDWDAQLWRRGSG